jgi:hypothetical protein
MVEDEWSEVVATLFRGADAKNLSIVLKRMALQFLESQGHMPNTTIRQSTGGDGASTDTNDPIPMSVLTAAEAMGFREKNYDYLLHAKPEHKRSQASIPLTLPTAAILRCILRYQHSTETSSATIILSLMVPQKPNNHPTHTPLFLARTHPH